MGKKKKKHLQACEMGGSLYGKTQTTVKVGFDKKDADKKRLMRDYTQLYKRQIAVMDKVFRRDK